MTQPRLYKQVRPSGRMSREGRIIIAKNLPAIVCTVIDYSAGGACLEIGGQSALPERFEFLYGTVKKRSRVVWKRGIRIGVAF